VDAVSADAYRDAWLAEMWPVCREVPREQREADRKLARVSPAVEKAVDERREKAS
jgi:hypothetical protein